jgi:hypothetical protein
MTEYIKFWLAQDVAALITLIPLVILFAIGFGILYWYEDRDSNE